MSTPTLFRLALIVAAALILIGCVAGGPTATPNLVETEVAVQKAALATLTAEAPAETTESTGETATPSPRPTAETVAEESDTPTPTDAAGQQSDEDTPTTQPQCSVVSNALNLRVGPGTIYQPPLTALPRGTELNPQAFFPSGFPAGQWIEVTVQDSGQVGWVGAESQFVSCDINPAELPVGTAPPTPTPEPTATPLPTNTPLPTLPPIPTPPELVVLPPDGGKSASGLEGQIVIPVAVEVTSDLVAIFSEQLAFNVEVYDPSEGTRDGDGIREVEIIIRDEDGDRVHERTERNAAYCVFGGGEPDCNVWDIEDRYFKWPAGNDMVSGKYEVEIIFTRDDGSEADWRWSFLLKL